MLTANYAYSQSEVTYDSPVGDWVGEYETMKGGLKKDSITIVDETTGKDTLSGESTYFYSVDDQGRWEGYWVEAGGWRCVEKKHDSNMWGVSIYQFNEANNEYEGTWDMCGEGKKYKMTGVRK